MRKLEKTSFLAFLRVYWPMCQNPRSREKVQAGLLLGVLISMSLLEPSSVWCLGSHDKCRVCFSFANRFDLVCHFQLTRLSILRFGIQYKGVDHGGVNAFEN